MSNTNVAQNSTDGKHMLRQAFNSFLDTVILENATKRFDCWYLFAINLPQEDKKLFLSYLVDIDDYADFTSNPVRERAAFKEYEPEMQYLINKRIDDLCHDFNYETRSQS